MDVAVALDSSMQRVIDRNDEDEWVSGWIGEKWDPKVTGACICEKFTGFPCT